jgi:hypothetical protein
MPNDTGIDMGILTCKCGLLRARGVVKAQRLKTRTAGSQFVLHFTGLTGEFFVHERGMIRCAICGTQAMAIRAEDSHA